jgi:hypothetical protein
VIRIGQLWKVNGITYRVESLVSGAQLNEVSRDAFIDAEIDAQLAALHPSLHCCSLLPELYAPRGMRVDLRWFERSDVKLIQESRP